MCLNISDIWQILVVCPRQRGEPGVRGRVAYREQKFECGEFLEVNIYPVFQSPVRGRRRAKRKPTREVQQALNRLNAAKEVNRVICANFTNQDYYITLTFKGDPPDLERAKKDVANFLKKLERMMRRKGLGKPKWIKTIEVGAKSGRIHVHMVISGGLLPVDYQRLWGKGYVDCKPLMFGADGVMGLSRYFIKQSRNVPGDEHKAKSWSCSRNCIRPEPKTNDYRYSRKRAAEITRERENSRLIEKLYPGYFCSSCEAFYNDESGHYYLHLRFYKKNARLDL